MVELWEGAEYWTWESWKRQPFGVWGGARRSPSVEGTKCWDWPPWFEDIDGGNVDDWKNGTEVNRLKSVTFQKVTLWTATFQACEKRKQPVLDWSCRLAFCDGHSLQTLLHSFSQKCVLLPLFCWGGGTSFSLHMCVKSWLAGHCAMSLKWSPLQPSTEKKLARIFSLGGKATIARVFFCCCFCLFVGFFLFFFAFFCVFDLSVMASRA